ncbi:MAG: hypothetical protein JNL18_04170 [Planctomycetaceae bacterium]|nr:hypothetical protein [Planctomycetaceae bacterium]
MSTKFTIWRRSSGGSDIPCSPNVDDSFDTEEDVAEYNVLREFISLLSLKCAAKVSPFTLLTVSLMGLSA